MASKLETINDLLENNSNVVVINKTRDREIYLPETQERYKDLIKRNLEGHFRDQVVIWIAPKKGLYSPKGLNEFMRSLIPNLKPKKTELFKEYHGGGVPIQKFLNYGHLKFQETIGEEKILQQRTLKLTDEEIKNNKLFKNFINGKLETNLSGKRNIYREIVICPVPNKNIGKGILRAYPHTNSSSAIVARKTIPLEILEKYKTSKSKSGFTRALYKAFGQKT